MSPRTGSFGANSLDGKVAVVVGASRGIGAAVAARLAADGARVWLGGRDATALQEQVRALRAAGRDAHWHRVDVSDDRSVDQFFAAVLRGQRRLDVAVNCAGVSGRFPVPIAEVAPPEFDEILAVNLRGTFICLRQELHAMVASGGGGAIVNMSSTAGEHGVAGLGPYVVSKWAVAGLTRTAALDYAALGIRVNGLAPGPILTDRLARAGQPARTAAAAAVPLLRLGSVDDVADAAAWLCSASSAFVTGMMLPVDGGQLAGVPAFATAKLAASSRSAPGR